jgi:hypothetical protein
MQNHAPETASVHYAGDCTRASAMLRKLVEWLGFFIEKE